MAYPELTAARLQDRVRRACAWIRPGDWPGELAPLEVFNEVGEWLTSCHHWNHLAREPVDLDIVAGQSYIDLPADFARIEAIGEGTTRGYSIAIGDNFAVSRALSNQATSGIFRSFVGSLVGTAPTLAGPQSRLVLALGPTPQAAATGAFLLTYRAGWVALTKLEDHVLLPSWLIGLYVRACVEYMSGYERSIKGSLEERLDRLRGSSFFDAAIDRDDTLQTDLGQSINGAESQITGEGGGEYWHADRSNQPNIIVGS